MKRERFTVKISVYAYLYKDGNLLFARRINTGWGDGKYGMIAGHLEEKEILTECIIREAKEEAGITIQQKDLQIIHIMQRLDCPDYLDIFFLAKKWQGEPHITEPDKCDDMEWFDENNLPDNLLPYLKQAWSNYKKNIYFATF